MLEGEVRDEGTGSLPGGPFSLAFRPLLGDTSDRVTTPAR